MTSQIKILTQARTSIKKLAKLVQDNIKNSIKELADNPCPLGVKKIISKL